MPDAVCVAVWRNTPAWATVPGTAIPPTVRRATVRAAAGEFWHYLTAGPLHPDLVRFVVAAKQFGFSERMASADGAPAVSASGRSAAWPDTGEPTSRTADRPGGRERSREHPG
jgi:hypothetical protein